MKRDTGTHRPDLPVSTAGSAIPQSTPRYTGGSVADSGYLPATTAPDPGYAVFSLAEDSQPPATASTSAAISPTRSRGRERRSRPGPRRTRRGSRRVGGRSPDDDSEGPSDSDPPPLPLRIVGTAGDDSAVESAFLSILHRRHPGTRWEVSSWAS